MRQVIIGSNDDRMYASLGLNELLSYWNVPKPWLVITDKESLLFIE